jgi:hypothetical protein
MGGIYIKGLPMPRSEDEGFLIAIFDGFAQKVGTREEFVAYEVVSEMEKITKPHGRLIDADALKEQLEYVASLEWNQRVGASPGIECAIDMLDDAQTVIPAEEGE